MQKVLCLVHERRGRILRDERGVTLIEALIAVIIFTLVGSVVLSGVSTTNISGNLTEGQSVTENIARNQMEYVFSLPYQNPPYTYPSISTPATYTVTAVAQEYVAGDPNIEKVVVRVLRDGRELLMLETLRLK